MSLCVMYAKRGLSLPVESPRAGACDDDGGALSSQGSQVGGVRFAVKFAARESRPFEHCESIRVHNLRAADELQRGSLRTRTRDDEAYYLICTILRSFHKEASSRVLSTIHTLVRTSTNL